MLEWMGMMLVGFGSGELDRVEAVRRSSGKWPRGASRREVLR